MVSADGRYVISYNGEVYNFQDLRVELREAGYRFQSHTDSEVVLYAFAEWGPECVRRFNGMFAFVVWDCKERTIHLARDRYGIKPLYYAQWGDTFLFGSEQKAILEHPSARKEIDKKALVEYFTFQNFFTDRTLLKNVKIFPPATYGRIDLNSQTKILQLNSYWDFHFEEPKKPYDLREYEEELDRLLKQAVHRQLVTDVELGSYLSGGMDSGTLTALASGGCPILRLSPADLISLPPPVWNWRLMKGRKLKPCPLVTRPNITKWYLKPGIWSVVFPSWRGTLRNRESGRVIRTITLQDWRVSL